MVQCQAYVVQLGYITSKLASILSVIETLYVLDSYFVCGHQNEMGDLLSPYYPVWLEYEQHPEKSEKTSYVIQKTMAI